MNNTKKIDGSNLYVCSDGTVWSEFGGKLKKLNPETTRLGYVRVTTSSIGGKRRRKLLHVLVAEAFIHKPKGSTEVNHKNGLKTDNRAENLEWTTHSENMKHAFGNGLIKPLRGNKSTSAKLTEDDVVKIKQELKAPYYSGMIRKIAMRYGVVPEAISAIRHGKNWSHVGINE